MKKSKSGMKILRRLRALSVQQLLTRYAAGERHFSRCNLLGPEIESAADDLSGLYCLEHTARHLYNPLWIDFCSGGAAELEWDRYGRCLAFSPDDSPSTRDLRGVQLSGIDLSGSYVYPADFSGADLTRADLRRAIFIDCAFTGATLARCDLRDAQFRNCNFRDANFYMARMDRVVAVECDARGCNLRRAKLYRANLSWLDLRSAVFQQAHCEQLNLIDTDLRGVDLSAVRLPNARVSGSRISRRQARALLNALEVRVEEGKRTVQE